MKDVFSLRIEDVGIPVKVKEEGFITISLELRAQKLEEPTIIIETELDEKVEKKLREEFRSLGPTSSNYARWKQRALKNGTLKKELWIHGGDIIRVTKEVRNVETEKLVVNFPVDVSFFYL